MTPETGMIGILVDDHEEHSYHRFLKDNTIDIISTRHPVYEERPPPIGFGCLFFINKSDYVDIPKEVKIWHGEVMLWQMMERKKGNHVISNCEAYTPWHATCNSIAQDDGDLYFQIQQNDNYLFNNFSIEGLEVGVLGCWGFRVLVEIPPFSRSLPPHLPTSPENWIKLGSKTARHC